MKTNNKSDMPPVYKAILEHFSPPPGQGNAYFQLNWTILLALVPFLVYLLAFFDKPFISWVLFIYSLFLIIFHIIIINEFKKAMAYVSNPFDFVKVELINFVLIVVYFGLSFLFLWKLDQGQYHDQNSSLSVLDMIYYSFVTVATLGYGDIYPTSACSKILVISELCFGIWFVATILPVAVADQAERLRHFRISQMKVMKEIKKGLKKGELEEIDGFKKEGKNNAPKMTSDNTE
jgi:hypothetical protein